MLNALGPLRALVAPFYSSPPMGSPPPLLPYYTRLFRDNSGYFIGISEYHNVIHFLVLGSSCSYLYAKKWIFFQGLLQSRAKGPGSPVASFSRGR